VPGVGQLGASPEQLVVAQLGVVQAHPLGANDRLRLFQ
jgi:hypothetical protein